MPLFPVKDRTIRLTLEQPSSSSKDTAASQPRYISQFIPNGGLLGGIVSGLGLTDVNSTLDLVGPTSINIKHAADVATESGLFTNFIQPWFIKPVVITIQGNSYLGAYTGLARSDNDLQQIIKRFRKSQNDFTNLKGSPGTAQRMLLELTGMPAGLSRFKGYMTGFDLNEDIKTVYLVNYTISFVGLNVDQSSVATGKANAQTAWKDNGVSHA